MYNIYAHVHTHTLYCQNSTATHNSPKLETTEFSSALKYVIKSQYNVQMEYGQPGKSVNCSHAQPCGAGLQIKPGAKEVNHTRDYATRFCLHEVPNEKDRSQSSEWLWEVGQSRAGARNVSFIWVLVTRPNSTCKNTLRCIIIFTIGVMNYESQAL